ncbi:hypothetical protein KJ765_00955 [Candidatus Micrarchaeota archaeon]|nr:hypothetical protein [Candidatus Micrarchaeota archaeon]
MRWPNRFILLIVFLVLLLPFSAHAQSLGFSELELACSTSLFCWTILPTSSVQLTPPGESLPSREPALFDIFVATEENPDGYSYRDEKAAQFTIGEDSIYFMVKMQNARKGEKLTVTLVPIDERYGSRLCSYEFQDDQHANSKFKIKFECPVLGATGVGARTTNPWQPGKYRVFVAHTYTDYSTIRDRGGDADRYWGYSDKTFFIELVSGEGETRQLEQEPVFEIPEKTWGDRYQLSYTVRVLDPLNPEKPQFIDKVTSRYSQTIDRAIFPSDLKYAPAMDVSVTKLGLTLYDEGKNVLCTGVIEEPDGLLGSEKADCSASPSYIRCAGPGRDEIFEVSFCGFQFKDREYHMRAGLRTYSYEEENGAERSPLDTAYLDAHSQPRLSQRVFFDNSEFVFNSKNTQAELKLVSLDPVSEKGWILKNPDILFKVVESASSCLKAGESFKATDKENVFALSFEYDPLCQMCGVFDAVEVSVPGILEKPNTIRARFSCSADNLVLTSKKLDLEDSTLNAALRNYVESHPLRTRLAVIDDVGSLQSFDPNAKTMFERVNDETTRNRLVVNRVRRKVNPIQVVLLGDERVLPFGIKTYQTSSGGSLSFETDDAYGMIPNDVFPKIPVGRITGFDPRNGDASDPATLAIMLQQTADALTPLKENRKPLVVGPAEHLEIVDPRYIDVRLDAFVEGFNNHIDHFDFDHYGCSAYPELCVFSPPYCIHSYTGSCTDSKSYVNRLEGSSFIALFPSHLTDVAVLAKDTSKNPYFMLSSFSDKDFPKFDLENRPIVFIARRDDSLLGISSTLGRGAAALISERNAQVIEENYGLIGMIFAGLHEKQKTGTLGEALLVLKRELISPDIPSKNLNPNVYVFPYAFHLTGDPSIPLFFDEPVVEATPTPSPSPAIVTSPIPVIPVDNTIVTETAWGDRYWVSYRLSAAKKAEPWTRVIELGDTGKLSTIFKTPISAYNHLSHPFTSSDYAEPLLEKLTLRIYEKEGDTPFEISTQICEDVLDDSTQLQVYSSVVDCAMAPPSVLCAGEGKMEGVEARFCGIEENSKGEFEVIVLVSTYTPAVAGVQD